MRVSQLDSHLLDAELFTLLSSNLTSALSLYSPTGRITTVATTALRAIIWKIGIWDHDNTYGSQLQSLRYFNLTRNKKIILGLISVFGPILQEKLGGELQGRWKQLVTRLEAAYETLALLNFLAYIAGGRYDSVLHRVLRVQLRPISSAYRAVSFEFLNRQLIWSQFREFLLVFLPLLNLPRIRQRLVSYLPQPESQKLNFLPRRVCAICYSEGVEGADCVNPYEADCGDLYCYVCIVSQIRLAEGEGWDCLRCGLKIKQAMPWLELDSENSGGLLLQAKSEVQQEEGVEDETEDTLSIDDESDDTNSDISAT